MNVVICVNGMSFIPVDIAKVDQGIGEERTKQETLTDML